MAREFQVTVVNRQRAARVDTAALQRYLQRVIEELPPERPGSLALCLVSDRKMREYNARFRGRDVPTDVLAFPGDDDAEDAPGERHLGDLLISVTSAARQARERGHSLERETRILALHGYLHLLGFDHETDDGQMLRLQRRLQGRLLPPGARRGAR